MSSLPATPLRSFASDNAAGVHPRVLEAIAEANVGHAVAYGADRWTKATEEAFRELFGPATTTLLALNGTGSNVVALGALLRPAECVVCTETSHVHVDETGATERTIGAKVLDLPQHGGKLLPDQLDELGWMFGDVHHAQPGVLSIAQCTELGTLYTADEIGSLCDAAHRLGMRVHVDGARIANATAALGGDQKALHAFTVDAGVDVLTFGGTKNGLLGAEAVVFLNPDHARYAAYLRKQLNQLASKMRFVAAQFLAIIRDDLWIELADHANHMSTRLWEATNDVPGVEHDGPPAANSLFPRLPDDMIDPLREWSVFYEWDRSQRQVRWMTSWDTTDDDVKVFADGIRHHLAPRGERA